jgi:endonuclease YncB( thermonuclease family)
VTGEPFTYRAVVRRWYDGDTVYLDVDLGFGAWIHGRDFRLLGCNTPEVRGGAAESAAGHAVLSVCRHLAPEGGAVIVTTQKDKRDVYGRFLARIRLADGSDLTEHLVAAGYAVAYDGKGRRPSWPWPGWRWPPGAEPILEAR